MKLGVLIESDTSFKKHSSIKEGWWKKIMEHIVSFLYINSFIIKWVEWSQWNARPIVIYGNSVPGLLMWDELKWKIKTPIVERREYCIYTHTSIRRLKTTGIIMSEIEKKIEMGGEEKDEEREVVDHWSHEHSLTLLEWSEMKLYDLQFVW